jgi:hypothetical protein
MGGLLKQITRWLYDNNFLEALSQIACPVRYLMRLSGPAWRTTIMYLLNSSVMALGTGEPVVDVF